MSDEGGEKTEEASDNKVKDKDVFKVTYTPERPWRERLGRLVAEAVDHTVVRLLSKWWGLQLR